MNIPAHGIVAAGILLFFQTVLIFWSWRHSASAGTVFLVGLVPVVGIPLLLYRDRKRIRDNHIAGALTYLALLVSGPFFIFWYPEAMEDDIPWALIHTMEFFALLGLGNLVLAPFRDYIPPEK